MNTHTTPNEKYQAERARLAAMIEGDRRERTAIASFALFVIYSILAALAAYGGLVLLWPYFVK